MKKATSFAIVIFIYLSAAAQVPVNDAIKLKALLNAQSGVFDAAQANAINAITKNYTKGSLKVIYQTNPFLAPYCSNLVAVTEATDKGIETITPGKAINTGSIVLDALSRFIVERIKKELQASFFEKLYTFLNKPAYRDCRTLFPNTYQVMLSIGDQIYNYETYLTSLRNAFGKDLEIIYPNLENVVRNGQFAAFFTEHRELRSLSLTALFIAKGIKHGDHIGTILEKFPATDPDYIPASGTNEENASLVHTIQFVQELSKSLRSDTGDPNRYWVNNATLDQLKDETTLRLYLGLLYERTQNISFGPGANENFGMLLAKAKDKFDQLKQLISATTDNIRECEEKFDSLRANKSIENYTNYINAISGLLNGIRSARPFSDLTTLTASPLPEAIQTKIDKVWDLLDKTNFVIDNAMNIHIHLKEKKYTLAASDLRNIYKERFCVDKIASGHSTETKRIHAIVDFLIDYGSALAEMAEAKDSKEVYAAIDRIAAPVGSSRIKKESAFSISLNAYGGVFIGKEYIEGVTDNSTANNYGVSAPVGLAFSFGRIKVDKTNITNGFKSLTLFLSVIDLGAPVSFRFQNDKLNEIPAISWKDVVSPGVFLMYGFGKVPLSISIGWQTGPNLRKVSPELNEYANSKYSRLSVGLFVDIPVLMVSKRKYW